MGASPNVQVPRDEVQRYVRQERRVRGADQRVGPVETADRTFELAGRLGHRCPMLSDGPSKTDDLERTMASDASRRIDQHIKSLSIDLKKGDAVNEPALKELVRAAVAKNGGKR